MRRSTFVRGVGVVSPFGIGRGGFYRSVFAGESALHPSITYRDSQGSPLCVGSFPCDLLAYVIRQRPLAESISIIAAEEALVESEPQQRHRFGLIVSSTKADLSGILSPGDGFGLVGQFVDRLAAALEFGGPRLAITNACASGLSAIAMASRWIADDAADDILVVGVDVLSHFVSAGFGALFALDPNRCRPFDDSRRGLNLGEAAAALWLSAQRKTGAPVVLGCGSANDASHVTSPSRDGRGLSLAIKRALDQSQIEAGAIRCIHLHGTGTVYNDLMESVALKSVFGAQQPPATANKGQFGHTLGAAGVLETALCLEIMQRGVIPMTVGCQKFGVDPSLNLVTKTNLAAPTVPLLKVGSGFGGISEAVVFSQ